jgi:glycosyltransferase involved in cell wall biosynthesis
VKVRESRPSVVRIRRGAVTPLTPHSGIRTATNGCHTDWVHLPLLRRVKVPFLTTLHGRLDLPAVAAAVRRFGDTPFVSISNNQRTPVPDIRWVDTVYHGLPLDTLRVSSSASSYLAFLGRIAPEKGPHVAIRWARAAGLKLRIAAKIPSGEGRFFREQIKPLVDKHDVEFVGEVNDKNKAALLGSAKALLFPIDWPEPFGLVMIEAMACGTPVIALPCGSVPEIISEGETGFIVNNDNEAVDAINRVGSLERARVRLEFERRFSARRMAEDYLCCYADLVAHPGRSRQALSTSRPRHSRTEKDLRAPLC